MTASLKNPTNWAAVFESIMGRWSPGSPSQAETTHLNSNFVSAIPCFSSNGNSARAEAAPFEPSAVPYIEEATPVEEIELQPQVS
jgi:hypothetical protein